MKEWVHGDLVAGQMTAIGEFVNDLMRTRRELHYRELLKKAAS